MGNTKPIFGSDNVCLSCKKPSLSLCGIDASRRWAAGCHADDNIPGSFS